jgi:hypothetical protein
MINFEQPTNENPFGKISVFIDSSYDRNLFQPPFTFQVVNNIDGEVKWEISNMVEGWWSNFVEPCNSEAIVKDSRGLIVYSWKWNTDDHGDKSHKVFLEWCKRNKNSKGISIGTHNGTTGEWVVPVMDGLIEAYLVEASDKQYNELVNNYKNVSNTHTIQSLITTDGLDIEFFESEDSFTNSTSKEHVLKFNDTVISVLKNSKSLNDLIIECGLKDDLKWLHLDVEGIDDELIMSLDDTKVRMPEIIIYESLNLTDDRKRNAIKWLESKGYQCEESGWNTIAIINKPDVSLLVHTCDSYERFWGGMFYTLDSYWNYNYIPVYFANEEKKMSDIVIDCKGSEYKPDKRIKQIPTGRTDKNGFSTRFIEAVKQVPSKYIIYMQEDMWLKRNLDNQLLNDLIKFMDDVNANSVRIHAKLFYYDGYLMEPTEHFIKGQRMLKNVGGDILSHNATIWRKDYILQHQVEGEDPWVNEREGSRRMSSDNNNNYHYNIHWYCQPGIADKGEQSQESIVYAHIVDEMKSMELKLNLKK